MRLLLVEWRDAAMAPTGWQEIAEMAEMRPLAVRSVGFELAADEERIVLASTVGEGSDCGGAIVIPRAWIKRLTAISLPKRRPARKV